MINFDEVIVENTQENNPHWSEISNDPYRIQVVGSSGSGKNNALLNIINHLPDIDKSFLYIKDLCKPKYQYLIKKWKRIGVNDCKDQRLSWITLMIPKMSTKVLNITIQEKKEKS